MAVPEVIKNPLEIACGPENACAWTKPEASDERVALLVAGVNYPRRKYSNEDPGGYNRTYFEYCLKYKTYLLKENLVEHVIIFDFLTGETRSYGKNENGQLNRAYGKLHVKNYRYQIPHKDKDKAPQPINSTLTVKRTPDPKQQILRPYFTAIDDRAEELHGNRDADVLFKDYHTWGGGFEKSMSISDVYDMFQAVSTPRYKELHFFGHAIHDGPVIVNTYSYTSKYYDKDPRTKDFSNRTLDRVFGAGLAKSQASFLPDPVVCIWGCDSGEEGARAVELLKAAQEKDRARKGGYAAELNEVAGKILATSYASHLAKTMKFRVIAAPPGTGSVHEGQDPDPKAAHITFVPTAMHVSFTAHEELMRLYKTYLHVEFAKDGAFKGHPTYGRGYIFYDP